MGQLSEVKKLLEQLKPELAQKFHVHTIRLFGSVVRDDFCPSSDIDIIVDFDCLIGIEFVDLADYMEQRLQQKIDLVSGNGVKDQYFKAIKRKIVYI